MDNKTVEQYEKEMMEMYNAAKTAVSMPQDEAKQTEKAKAVFDGNEDSVGGLQAFVTTVNGLYPVGNARVTVFTGNIDDMQTVAEAVTDQNGKTEVINLKTPAKSLSLTAGGSATPYSSYNMLAEADGYVRNIHLNIPIFSGVTSMQSSDLLLNEISGVDKNGQVFDESSRFEL